jgi:oxygen-independent coproporphyrinogen-3 oxidase
MSRQFGIYLHVPFCASRCGYCDFNTYTAADLGGGASRAAYPRTAAAEIRMAARELPGPPTVSTVFVGGGTPTLLEPVELGGLLDVIRAEFPVAADVEITTEANPESVDPTRLEQLRVAGFTRISFGMQSAREHVLATLDRQHTPGRATDCAGWARAAGFEHVSLDLIYGTPGETDSDWRCSLDTAVAAGPDHVSAYSLTVEDGTRLAAQVRRGELVAPDPDVLADRYLIADAVLGAAGYGWYEISNWARSATDACRHNQIYWTGGNWWGIGPGAHSHYNGRRWWNVKHPREYADRLSRNCSPAADSETLTAAQKSLERTMLGLRLRSGLPLGDLSESVRPAVERAVRDGLLDADEQLNGRAVLTLRGRLLADTVIRELTD